MDGIKPAPLQSDEEGTHMASIGPSTRPHKTSRQALSAPRIILTHRRDRHGRQGGGVAIYASNK